MLETTLVISLLCAAVCAVRALSVKTLLPAAIWLAGSSAFTAGALYLLGGHVAAVMELSIGAGLVTVLFVFAIDLVGDAPRALKAIVPWWLAVGAVIVIGLAIASFVLPIVDVGPTADETLAGVMWGDRQLDMLVQLVWMISGALTITGLLVERSVATFKEARKPVTPETIASATAAPSKEAHA
jgi:NADH:ubiquinone oxidoreductase subunit 6 (subunit J)